MDGSKTKISSEGKSRISKKGKGWTYSKISQLTSVRAELIPVAVVFPTEFKYAPTELFPLTGGGRCGHAPPTPPPLPAL